VLTRESWIRGSLFAIVMTASASVAIAAPSPRPSQTGATPGLDLAHRAQAGRALADRHGEPFSADFLAGPRCEVNEHVSAEQFGFVHTRRGSGVTGGSYGEIFFASGAGTRASSTGSSKGNSEGMTGTSPSQGGSGSPSQGGSGSSGPGPGAGSAKGPSAGNLPPSPPHGDDNGDDPPDPPGDNSGGTGGASSTGQGSLGGLSPVAVNPEPGTLILLGTGFGTLLIARRRQNRGGKK
jgi:PEP-CTERM motif-containing protein